MSPFMKGMHNRIDRWRYDQYLGGWKLTEKTLAGNVSRTIPDVADVHGPEDFKRWCRNWMGLRDSPYRSIQQLI